MFIRNMPLSVKVALCASNEALRQLMLLDQPELWLENHQVLEGEPGSAKFSTLTTYATFKRKSQIEVEVIVATSLADPWALRKGGEPRVSGFVRVVYNGPPPTSTWVLRFQVQWVRPLKGESYYPKVVLTKFTG